MNKNTDSDLQPLKPLVPGQADMRTPGVSDKATIKELTICNGPMPAMVEKKEGYQLPVAIVSDTATSLSAKMQEEAIFSGTIFPQENSPLNMPPVKFNTILLPTDLSPNSDAAVSFAVALAKQSGGTIHLFHAFESQPGGAFSAGIWNENSPLVAGARNNRKAQLNRFAINLAASTGLKLTQFCVDGHPAVEAIKFAHEIKADLIVLATHGRTGIPHWFLGSVAEKIVRLSSIPVLTVRPGETVQDTLAIKTILLPTDFSDNANTARPIAIEFAKANGAKLVLIHVIENSTYYGDPTWSVGVGPDMGQYAEQLHAQGEKKLAEAKLSLEKDSGVEVKAILKCGRAFDEICLIASQEKADIVIMSTHGYTGFTHFAFGSVTERVLRTCPVPLLTIKIGGAVV